ncbi:MAG: ABC transporter ATP-binding protein [Eubacteriales bacterium]|nr:ABC transporter ATP-binding protein [Eubacteriales bacterium]
MSINMDNVTVTFKNKVTAVDHVSMSMEHGIYGLLGENGAGKTTLMRVLTTIIKPGEGRIDLNGIPYTEENYGKIRQRIGYLPQEINLYPDLTVRECLEYLGGLSRLTKAECKKRIDYYLERTSLTDHQRKKNRQLSGGMKRRVGLIQALLNEPEFLVVDEPTTGLDPEERIRIRNLLVDFSESRTVLFSTHVVEDLAATCNQLAVMKKGSFLYCGSVYELLEQAKGHVWICPAGTDDDIRRMEREYHVSSKQYTEEGLKIKIIGDKSPGLDCYPADVSLEDAYIYLMNYCS